MKSELALHQASSDDLGGEFQQSFFEINHKEHLDLTR
jgi:hypothetical protein